MRRGGAERLSETTEGEIFVVVHSLAEACAALAAARAVGRVVTLASAPGAGGYAGAGWFRALVECAAGEVPGAGGDAILDCAAEAGTVLAALRAGMKRLRFTGSEAAASRLAEIAAAQGARLTRAALAPALDLAGCAAPEAACRAFLARNGSGA